MLRFYGKVVSHFCVILVDKILNNMKHFRKTIKVVTACILLLFCSNVSSLFAASAPGGMDLQQQQIEQIQQLRQQAANTDPVLAQNQAQQLPPSDPPPDNNSQPAANLPQAQALIAAATAPYQPGPIAPLPPSGTLPAPGGAAPQVPGAPDQGLAPNPGGGPGASNPNNAGKVSTQDLRNKAFNDMVQNQLPMSPDQIQKLRSLFNQTQFAVASTPGVPPKPTATSQLVNLAPGSTPPVIRLAQGFVSSLVFIDSTGAPWPIDNYDIGNPSAFNIQWNKSDNTLMIQATTLYTYGNLAVRLQGLNTPVMLTLVPGQKDVDYRVDLRIQGTGPNAAPIPVVGLPCPANPELLGVLDGVPPTGSSAVQVAGCGGVQAWIRGDQLFVRTRYTILSPGWISTMSSADGMKAYLMPKTPLLLAAENGKVTQLKIEGL